MNRMSRLLCAVIVSTCSYGALAEYLVIPGSRIDSDTRTLLDKLNTFVKARGSIDWNLRDDGNNILLDISAERLFGAIMGATTYPGGAFSPEDAVNLKDGLQAAADAENGGERSQKWNDGLRRAFMSQSSRKLREDLDGAALANKMQPAPVGSGNKGNGLVVGEIHSEQSARNWLTNNLEGINTLYLEHFQTDHQPLLDAITPDGEIPPELRPIFANYKGLETLVKNAISRDIVVRALDDTSAKAEDHSGEDWERHRTRRFNQRAHEVVEADRHKNPQNRVALLVGTKHVGAHQDFDHGLARRLGFEAKKVENDEETKLNEDGSWPDKSIAPRNARTDRDQMAERVDQTAKLLDEEERSAAGGDREVLPRGDELQQNSKFERFKRWVTSCCGSAARGESGNEERDPLLDRATDR